MRINIVFAILFLSLIFPAVGNAQCKDFTKSEGNGLLKPYQDDGYYYSSVLSEGESIVVLRTFYKGTDYRISVFGAKNIPKVEFKVLDAERNVLFDNSKNGYVKSWDFSAQVTQQLLIEAKLTHESTEGGTAASGCVGMVVGFLWTDSK